MRKPAFLCFLAVALGLLVLTESASAQTFKTIHRLARLIEQHAHELREEVDDHFKPSPAYERLHKHVREIERLAKEVYVITEVGDGRKRIRRAVEVLDEEVQNFVRLAEDSKHYKIIPVQSYLHLRRETRYLHEAIRDMRLALD